VLECRNADCLQKSTGKIRRWINSLDILGIGDVLLLALIERFDLADAADLYTLRQRSEALASLVTNTERDLRLGEKRADTLLDAIDATRRLTLAQFLGSLGLDHLGKRRVELMITAAAGPLDTLPGWRSGWLRDPDQAAKAGVPSMGAQIQDGIDAMGALIDKLLAVGITLLPTERQPVAADAAVALKTVCISGKLPSGKKKADYADPLRQAGYALVDDVAKELNFLVLADPASTSSKSQKAKKLGIEVISEEDLLGLLAT